MDMTKGNTPRLIIKFAFPLILGNMLQQLYIFTDTMIVGKVLGYRSLAALGSTDWISWFMTSIINGLTMGFCAKASQEKGENDPDRFKKTCAMCVSVSAVFSVIFLVVGQIIAKPALRMLNTPSDIMGEAYSYLQVIYLALPITLFYNALSALLRANGDSKTPFIAMLISSVTNVSLDILFVSAFKWGIRSAAIATAIAQCFSMIVCLIKILRTTETRFSMAHLKPDWTLIKQVLGQALPPALQFCIVAVSGLIIQTIYNKQGSVFIAGYTASNKYYGLVEMGAIAIASALLTYTGQNYGAGNYPRIKRGLKSGLICSAIFSLFVTLIMIFFGEPLLSLFISADADSAAMILKYAYQFLMFLSCPLYILYLHHILRSILQGMGDSITPVISGIMQFSFRIVSAYVFAYLWGSIGVFIAEPCAWLGSAMFLTIRLFFVSRKTRDKFITIQPDINQN